MAESNPTKRFKPEMPRLPGVTDSPTGAAAKLPEPPASTMPARSTLLSIAVILALFIIGGIGWWAMHLPAQHSQPAAQEEDTPAPPADIPPAPAAVASGPVIAATLDEMAKPWASKEFTFIDPATHDSVPGMVVHLGSANAKSSSSYWGFSLQFPYQTCQLEYVTDLSQIKSRYGYEAAHPMVASPCDGSVFDPLKMSTVDSGAWVRGEIVQGAGMRPPIAIEIKIDGDNLVADRIE